MEEHRDRDSNMVRDNNSSSNKGAHGEMGDTCRLLRGIMGWGYRLNRLDGM